MPSAFLTCLDSPIQVSLLLDVWERKQVTRVADCMPWPDRGSKACKAHVSAHGTRHCVSIICTGHMSSSKHASETLFVPALWDMAGFCRPGAELDLQGQDRKICGNPHHELKTILQVSDTGLLYRRIFALSASHNKCSWVQSSYVHHRLGQPSFHASRA